MPIDSPKGYEYIASPLTDRMRKCGLNVNARDPHMSSVPPQRLRDGIVRAAEDAKGWFNGVCQIIVVILPDKSLPL